MKNNISGHTGIQVQDVFLTYSWGDMNRQVFDGLILQIPAGSFVTITGDNASGKTSLLKLITGLLKPDQGHVVVNDIRINETGVEGARMAGVGFLSQNPIYQILGRTVREELDYVSTATVQERETVAEQFELTRLMTVSPQRLSGGERQRLALAVLALQQRSIVLLDEPSSYLDAVQIEKLQHYLNVIHQSGTTILHVTQYPEEAAWGQVIFRLDNGKCVEITG